MKKILLPIILGLAFPLSVFAQTKTFEGLSVYGALNHSSTTVDLKADGAEFSGLGKQSISGALGGDYGLSLGSESVMLIGGTVDLTSPEFLEITSDGDALKGKFKQRWSLYVAPGLLVNPQTLLYAKLSYESGKAELSAAGEKVSETFKGLGYGVGLRAMLKDNVFVGVEVSRINYNDKGFEGVNVGTGTTIGSVQIGYKF